MTRFVGTPSQARCPRPGARPPPSRGARAGRDHSLSPACAPTNRRRVLWTQCAPFALTLPPPHPPARTVMPPSAGLWRGPVGVLSESIHTVEALGPICRPSQGVALPRCGGRTRRTAPVRSREAQQSRGGHEARPPARARVPRGGSGSGAGLFGLYRRRPAFQARDLSTSRRKSGGGAWVKGEDR